MIGEMAGILTPITQLLLTVYYFFYFLVKGKPEWQCPKHERSERERTVCCDGKEDSHLSSPYSLHRPSQFTHSHSNSSFLYRISCIPSTIWSYTKSGALWVYDTIKSIPRFISNFAHQSSLRIFEVAKKLVRLFISGFKWVSSTLCSIFSCLWSLVLFRQPPSKTMPTYSTVYTPIQSSLKEKESMDGSDLAPTIPSTLEKESSFTDSISLKVSTPVPPPPPPPPPVVPYAQRKENTNRLQLSLAENEADTLNEESESGSKGGAFYTTRVFTSNLPASTPIEPSPIKMTQSYHEKNSSSKEALKGGIPVFPPSMMAEIAGSGGGAEQVTRSEVNRRSNPTVRERLRESSATPTNKKTEYNIVSNSRVNTPRGWGNEYGERTKRAQSAGPPRVSRIGDTSNNEAQFIFRAHEVNERQNGYDDSKMAGAYRMGSSVYSPPIAEIENMRHTMERRMDSRATTPSIYSGATSRISTPGLYAREDEWVRGGGDGMRHRGTTPISRGCVTSTARNWPPPTNAEGADIGKECFVDGNGVITTACTRVVEKKNEESWRWLDDNGRVIDEKTEYSIMGDRDELTREGPYQAQHLSQHYFIDRDGNTRFQNTHRQYDNNYVVESRLCRLTLEFHSVCRNY